MKFIDAITNLLRATEAQRVRIFNGLHMVVWNKKEKPVDTEYLNKLKRVYSAYIESGFISTPEDLIESLLITYKNRYG